MTLCKVCNGFDIRELLLQSTSQNPEATKNLNRLNVDPDDFRPPIPQFHKHHPTIVALKHAAAETDCNLCKFLWESWVKTLSKDDVTDEWLDRNFAGQLYLGSSSWTTSREGFPYVTLCQQTAGGASRTLASFEAFADRDDLPEDGRDILGRAVYADSSLPECTSVAAEWLQTCLESHKECGSSRDANPLPTRVIDVGDLNQQPKLITTNHKPGSWIALSYCWGGDSKFIFNDGMKDALENGIPIDDFPPTLRDAILITRQLGIKYVWIDALCIKQDSAEDWAREAAKMKEVYSGALLTVIASNSPSTHSGIFSHRKAGLRGVVEWKAPGHSEKSFSKAHLRSGNELWDHSLQSSPLMGRGWTLQEGLLAPRTLSYGSQQMIWECSQFQADEGGRTTKATEDYRSKGFIQRLIHSGQQQPVPKPQTSIFSRLSLRPSKQEEWWRSFSIANPYDKWYDISEQFTNRSLTKDFDVLPALAGLAGVFQHVLNDEYCAGLWKKDILCSLFWNRTPKYPADQSSRLDLTRKSTYLAPSWSWTSIPGRTASMTSNWKTRDAIQNGARSIAKIISVNTVPAGPDPFGRVSSGELVLRGRYCKLTRVPPIYSEENQWPQDESLEWGDSEKSVFQIHMYKYMLKVDTNIYERYQQHEECKDQEIGVVEIVHYDRAPGSGTPGIEFLIIESTGRIKDEFRRIGETGLRVYPVPNREEVTEAMFENIVEENEAYEEFVKAKWGKRTLTLV